VTTKVICFASAKGGSGKTFLTATLGTFLSKLDKKVLLIDTDAATNGLTLFYLPRIVRRTRTRGRTPLGLFETGASGWSNTPEPIEVGENVWLYPATFSFIDTEAALTPAEFEDRLRAAVDFGRREFDFVIIDAQAGADAYARAPLSPVISDTVVIVTEYDPSSVAGIERLKALFPQELRYERTWILLNKMLPEFVKSFRDYFAIARYLAPIPWEAEVVMAYARRTLALNTYTGNIHTHTIIEIVRAMLPECVGDIDAWLAGETVPLAATMRDEYKKGEVELRGLISMERHAARDLPLRLASVAAACELVGVISLSLTYYWIPLVVMLIGGAVLTFAGYRAYIGAPSEVVARRELLEERQEELEQLLSLNPESLLMQRRRV
jgi:cellulose biosynthesis protein BcsQ